MMFFGGPWMIIFWVVFVGLIVWGGTWLFRRGGSGFGERGKRDALEIARERYARGEISNEEYEEIKKNLSKLQ